MTPDNPYTPPTGAIDSEEAAERLRARKRQHRPLSHKCVLAFFAIYAAWCFATVPGMEVSPKMFGVILVICSMPVIAVVGLVGLRLSKLTYYFTSASLILLFITTSLWIRALLNSPSNGTVATQAGELLSSAAGVVLLVLLIWRYTFGTPSRTYYGFSSAPVRPELPKSVPSTRQGRGRSGASERLEY